jgi:hypothetical protein
VKHTSPTLLILAAMAIAPSVSALSVKDDDVKLGLALRIQARADVSDAETASGTPYDVMTGNANGGDPADFYLRRLRFGVKGSFKDDYKFNITFAADKAQAKDKGVALYEAYVARVWKDEDNKIEHELIFGQSNAFFNGVANSFSSSKFLLPGVRATDQMLASRGNGLGYRMNSEMVRFGADMQNNIKDDSSATKSDGLFYSARIELTPPGELGIKKVMESYVGQDGKGVMLSLDYGANVRQANTTTTTGYGTEWLVHVDGLTALAELRADDAENMTTNVKTKKQIWLVQAGYALPLGDAFIEPAIRYTSIDLDTDNEEEGSSYGTSLDFGASGSQFDAGVNYYIHGHNNKVQLAYTNWKGEENAGGDKAKADILRAQWQLDF